MTKNRAVHILVCFLVSFLANVCSGQGVKKSPQQNEKASAPTVKKIDACSLLTSAEIQAVQGEPLTSAKPSVQPGGGLLMSQCLFQTTTQAKSINLSLSAPDPAHPSANTPRKFWRQQFHNAGSQEKEKPSAGKTSKKAGPKHEEEDLPKPQAISGLGDEAFWISNPIAGVLYVLRGEVFLRVSIGGVREEPVRIEKSKTLARAALKRL